MDTIRDLMSRRFAACQLLANCMTAAEACHYIKNDKTQRNNAKLLAKAFGCGYAVRFIPELVLDNE